MIKYSLKSFICYAPWNLIRIEMDGYCYTCSSSYTKDYYCLGNIFTDDINEIWNGEKAKKFREDKLLKEYKYCKIEQCHLFAARNFNHYTPPSNFDMIAELPRYVSLSYDNSCSERCIFCRDKVIFLDKETANKWENILYSKIIPFLINAQLLEITCAGELFSSLHSQKMLKEIIKNNPKIKLKLFSNGINLTKDKINELGINNNIEEICISLHCASEKTYKQIFRCNNYNKVVRNLEYISELKKENKIKYFNLQFVITKYNYKEIKKFIQLCSKLGANPVFNYVIDNTEAEFINNKYNYELYNKKHYLYNDFVKQLQDDFVRKYLPEHLKELKKISFFHVFKNKLLYFHYLITKEDKL